MRARLVSAAIGVLAGLAGLAGPATGQQVTQGSPLTAAANYPYHCDYRWVAGYSGMPGAFGPGGYQDFVPQLIGPSTCTLFQIGASGQAATSHLVPGPGTVLRARIRSGPNPAPVSIATVRQFTGPDGLGGTTTTCCFGVSETPTVNPTPNGITEIPVNLLVAAQPYDPRVPNRAGFWDFVAVNVHGTTGTLPMADHGLPKPFFGAPPTDPGARWYFPQIDPSVNNQNQWTAAGFEVLMSFDWTATPAAATPPPAVTPAPARGVTRTGNARANTLAGSASADRLFGRGGNDRLRGLAGNDLLDGGAGNDRGDGGADNDRLVGRAGNDRLIGRAGRDVLIGGAGRDRLVGGPGIDSYNAGAGADVLDSRDGVVESVRCGAGRDRVRADRGDRLSGCEVAARA